MARALLERRQFAHECSLSQVLVRPYEARLVAGYSATLLVDFMNRRMRNRTSGGVGGRREQSRLLPDCACADIQIACVESRITSSACSFCATAPQSRFSCPALMASITMVTAAPPLVSSGL